MRRDVLRLVRLIRQSAITTRRHAVDRHLIMGYFCHVDSWSIGKYSISFATAITPAVPQSYNRSVFRCHEPYSVLYHSLRQRSTSLARAPGVRFPSSPNAIMTLQASWFFQNQVTIDQIMGLGSEHPPPQPWNLGRQECRLERSSQQDGFQPRRYLRVAGAISHVEMSCKISRQTSLAYVKGICHD